MNHVSLKRIGVGGADLQFTIPITLDNVFTHNPSQTLSITIERLSDNMWWNFSVPGWTLASEPAPTACPEIGSTGIFGTTLIGGYSNGDGPYRVHLVAAGTVEAEYYADIYVGVDKDVEFEDIKGTGFVKNTHSLVNNIYEIGVVNALVGTPVDLGDGASVASMLTAMADDAGGTTFDSSVSSLIKITGLAGGTDWTPSEQLEIKAILGVTGTGTPLTQPTTGSIRSLQDVLSNIDDAIYNGSLWLNGNVVNTGTTKGTDGILSNPVSTWEAIETLSTLTGIKTVFVKNPPVLDRNLQGFTIISLDGNSSLSLT